MRRIGVSTVGTAFALLALMPAAAQDDRVLQELEALKKGQQQILERLTELEKKVAQPAPARPTPPPGPDVSGKIVTIGDNPVVGKADALLTLIEWTDYQ